MARIKRIYTQRNFSPTTSQQVRLCTVQVNGQNVLDVGFNYFENYQADMPTFILSGDISGYSSNDDGSPMPLIHKSVVDLADIDSVEGLSRSDLDSFMWPRHQNPYGIHPIDFLDLNESTEWFFTGDASGNVFYTYSDDLDDFTTQPQLNVVNISGMHIPSQDFKGEVLSFFENIPSQNGDQNGIFQSGTNADFKNYISGLGLTCSGFGDGTGSGYLSGYESGFFSGFLSEDAYQSGSGFYYYNQQLVSEHLIYDDQAVVLSLAQNKFDADIGWFSMSAEEALDHRMSINNRSNLSSRLFVFYSGTGHTGV